MPATISTYATLTQAIGDFAHRTDLITGTPPYSDYFIQAAQEQFEKDILDFNFGVGIALQEFSYSPTLITGGVACSGSPCRRRKLRSVRWATPGLSRSPRVPRNSGDPEA